MYIYCSSISSISSEWQFTGVSKARLPSTSWTAAAPLRTLPVVSDFDLPAATISSYHARPSGVLRRRSDGLECAAWRPPKPVAQCRQFPEDAKDASVSECTWTHSALEALRNALYKFKTYLLTRVFNLLQAEIQIAEEVHRNKKFGNSWSRTFQRCCCAFWLTFWKTFCINPFRCNWNCRVDE